MKGLLGCSFDEFIDLGVYGGGECLFIICGDVDIAIESSSMRSKVEYLINVENCKVLHIKKMIELIVYLSKLESDDIKGIDVPNVYIWNCLIFNNDIILSKLLKIKSVVIGDLPKYEEKLKDWCSTIELKC